MILSGYVVMVFCFSNSQCKDELYSLFCHIICNLGISDDFDWSIYIFDHQSQSQNVTVSRVCCCFLASYMSRRCFSINRSMEFVVGIGSSAISIQCLYSFCIICLQIFRFSRVFWEFKYCVLFFQIVDDVFIMKVNVWFFCFYCVIRNHIFKILM